MERKGFTLIELIFVIVIIGVLSAVAIPKFQNLKQNAEVNNLFKIVTDMASSVPESYLNMVDLEGQAVADIDEIVKLSGKNWTHTDAVGGTHAGLYIYNDGGAGDVAVIRMEENRTLTYTVTCANFSDSKSREKCEKLTDTTNIMTDTISW